MQPKMTTEQLLIIGNGFDLACGLKSKYTDFFDSIPEKTYSDNFWYYILDCLRHRKLLESEMVNFLFEGKESIKKYRDTI